VTLRLVNCRCIIIIIIIITSYTPKRIFTQNTSNDVVPGKEVPFGGPDNYILYLDP